MMKNKILKYVGFLVVALFTFGCQDLERPDFSDFLYDGPVVTLIAPSPNGTTVVRSKDATGIVTIKYKVEDDLGIANITVKLDDAEISNESTFANIKLVEVDNLTQEVQNGTHTVTITVTDTNNVVATVTTTFEKVQTPPYIPIFSGEKFYMPFDGDFSEFISGNTATEVGSPAFTTATKVGSGAYSGADDAYLTYPTAGLLTNEFSGTFWYNLNNPGTNRAGIITISAPDTSNPLPTNGQGNLNFGIRVFREGGASQSIRLNVGNGTGRATAVAARLLTNTSGWVHVAFTINQSRARVYLDGVLERETAITGLNWTGCDVMSIMSGAPRYLIFNHKSDLSAMDELRFFDKELTQSDVLKSVVQGSKKFDMAFNNNYLETISKTDATVVGTPSFITMAKEGSHAYKGADDAYLTFPTAGLLSNEFSGAFWYNLNNPGTNRAGILTISAPDLSNPLPTNGQGNRNFGIRVFREGGASQSIRLNVGNGTGNGTAIAPRLLTNTSGWVHIAFTISQTKAILYLDGVLEREIDITGLNWTGCDLMSIMSGAPRYLIFNHKSDLSAMDSLGFYDKVLSQAEIQAIMN